MRRVVVAGAAILMAIAGLSLTTASAATLEVAAAPGVFLAQEPACGPSTANGFPIIDATASAPGTPGSYSGITLSNIPTACQDLDSPLPVDVFVHTAAGDLMSSGSGTVGSGTTTVGVGDYTGSAVTAVIVRIDGWLFPTTWTAPAPSNPAVPLGPITCYKVDSGGSVILDGAGEGVLCDNAPTISVDTWTSDGTNHMMQAEFSVMAVEPSILLVLDFSDPFFDAYQGDLAHSWVSHVRYGAVSDVAPDYSCSAMPVFEIKGTHPNVTWGAHSISGAVILNSQPADGAICSPL